jgi:hypothetical protein
LQKSKGRAETDLSPSDATGVLAQSAHGGNLSEGGELYRPLFWRGSRHDISWQQSTSGKSIVDPNSIPWRRQHPISGGSIVGLDGVPWWQQLPITSGSFINVLWWTAPSWNMYGETVRK